MIAQRKWFLDSILLFAVLAGAPAARAATPLGTAFTYQGQLKQSGTPVTGTANLQFSLWDAAAGPNQVGSTQTINGVSVTGGLFTVTLNAGGEFGAAPFNGEQRWLEISVHATTLAPRQEVTAAPNALFSLNADRLDGLDSSAFLQSIPVPLTLSGTSDTHILHVQNASSTHTSMAVLGESTGDGNTYGVFGKSPNGRGVYGATVHGFGVFGESTAEESYPGTSYGVYGQSGGQYGIGVFGYGPTGVWGETASTTGVAVHGRNTAATGGIGVFGSTNSADGYAGSFVGRGYFSGNVGIGVENPSHRLTVQSPTISTMRLIGPTGQYGYGARLNFGDANYAYIEEDQDDRLLLLATRFAFMTGYVGIGVNEPGFQLHLSTNSAAKPTSNTWTIASDRRLKKNIKTIDGALDQLMQLHGVTYQWIHPEAQGDMAGTYTGMIAQDVEKVFPEWISEGKDGYKHLTVIGFEGLTVEALRELRCEKDAQLAELRAEKDRQIAQRDRELAEQRKKMDDLTARLERLERLVGDPDRVELAISEGIHPRLAAGKKE